MHALILLILLGIDWASGYAIAGYCMRHGVNPYGYAFWQSFGPFVLLLAIQTIRKNLWISKSGARYALLCGVFGIVIPNLLIYFSIRHVESGIITVFANLSPVFTYIIAILLKDEKFQFTRFWWIVLAMVGLLIIIVPGQHEINISFNSYWIYIALLIPLSYAFSAVYLSKYNPGDNDILNYALWMLMASSLCISPLTVIQGEYYSLQFMDFNSSLIVLEILLSTLGYWLLFIIIQKVGSVYYSLVNTITAVMGVIYGYFIFNEHYSTSTYLAIGVIIISLLGLSLKQRRHAL